MNPFADVLRDLNARLDIPQPEKYRILLEISADLNDAADHFQSEGLSKDDAVRKAIETFDVSGESLAQLQAVHHNLFRRWIDRLSAQTWSRWEKAVFAVIFLFILLFSGREMLTGRFFVLAGGFAWPVAMAMAAAGPSRHPGHGSALPVFKRVRSVPGCLACARSDDCRQQSHPGSGHAIPSGKRLGNDRRSGGRITHQPVLGRIQCAPGTAGSVHRDVPIVIGDRHRGSHQSGHGDDGTQADPEHHPVRFRAVPHRRSYLVYPEQSGCKTTRRVTSIPGQGPQLLFQDPESDQS